MGGPRIDVDGDVDAAFFSTGKGRSGHDGKRAAGPQIKTFQ